MRLLTRILLAISFMLNSGLVLGEPMRLTNDSFPEGRQKYHATYLSSQPEVVKIIEIKAEVNPYLKETTLTTNAMSGEITRPRPKYICKGKAAKPRFGKQVSASRARFRASSFHRRFSE